MSATDFLTRLNARNASKRRSQQELAKALDQSPTETESDHIHGVNVTRFAEMHKHDHTHFQAQIQRRKAWQYASPEQRAEIMDAIVGL